MRPVLGPGAAVIGRRGIRLERCALVTLRRDAYAMPPGPTLGLAIGERTTYRPGAWLLDTFERPALGAAYPAWGGSDGLHRVGGQIVPVTVGDPGLAIHTRTLPRDAWAAVVIGALSGDAAVGVLLRAAADADDGYRITATPTVTRVERLDAGVSTELETVPTPWRVGDTLRAVWAWDRLTVYRDLIIVADLFDAARLLEGHAGMVAHRGDAGAAAGITAFLGGEARQEFLGAGLDLGDIQRVLGQPASFDVTLSNLAPMGGADRFARLLRHGINTTGTYDLDRGTVRLLTVIAGAPAPLTAGVGWIDGPGDVTEESVQLAVRGRDAFLSPRLAAGPVTYLPGPAPGGLAPLPPDPCLPSPTPTVEPGAPPAEPIDPPPTEGGDGIGPDAPPDADGDGGGEAGGLFEAHAAFGTDGGLFEEYVEAYAGRETNMWRTEPGESLGTPGAVYAITTWSLFREPGYPGSVLKTETGAPMALTADFAYPADAGETGSTPELTVDVIELGVPNPDLVAAVETPYVAPTTLAQVMAANQLLATWTTPAQVLQVLHTFTVPPLPKGTLGGVSTQFPIAPGGSLPIGTARWLTLRWAPARTALGLSCGVKLADGLGDTLTIAVPPP